MDLANEIRQLLQKRELARTKLADKLPGTHNFGSLYWELDTLTALTLLCEGSSHHHPYGPMARALAPLLREVAETMRATIHEGRRIANQLEAHCPGVPCLKDTSGWEYPDMSLDQQLRHILGVYK
jgi:hypothetical protein